MAVEKFADVASCQLTSNVVTTPTVGTVETWNVGSLQNLPTLASGDQWRGVVLPTGGDANPEIIIVTSSTSSTLTVKRGEGSNAVVKTHSSGDTVSLIMAAAQMVQMAFGTLSAVNYNSGVANLVLPDGTVAAVLPSSASFDPNIFAGATVGAMIGPNGPLIIGASTTRAKPSGHMHQSTPQTYPNAANTGVNGMTYDWLTGGMANSGSNGLTVPIAGNYRVTAAAGQSIGGIGEGVEPLITVNNAIVRIGNGGSAGGFVGSGVVADMVQLNASDIVGLSVWQNQGSNVSIANGTATYLTLEWVSWI